MRSAMGERIYKEISANDVVLYMRGSAAFPLCAPSAAIVHVLSRLRVPFKDVNIAEDGELRQALLEYADWPSLPQLYVRANFMGGADVIAQMDETGELAAILLSLGLMKKS